MRAAIAIVIVLLAGTAHADDRVARAKTAIDKLQFKEAGQLLDAAIQSGELDAPALAEAYELSGIVAIVVDDVNADGRFRRALAIDPDLALPAGSAPKLTTAFDKARSYVAKHGMFKMVVAKTRRGVRVAVQNDPVHLAHDVELRTRDGASIKREVATATLNIKVPSGTEVVSAIIHDEYGNVVADEPAASFGTAAEAAPIASPITDGEPPWYRSPAPWWIGSGVAIAVGLFATYEASAASDRLAQIIASSAMYNFDEAEAERTSWHRDALVADLSLGVGGALAVIGVVMAVTRPVSTTQVRPTADRTGAGVELVLHW